MLNNNLLQQLQQRNIIAQVTNQQDLSKILSTRRITVYCGFDPTGSSLHLGHLVPLLCLKRFQLAGHKPIVLIGGATGLIGDPSFKVVKRKFLDIAIIKKWIEKIKHQIALFLNFNCSYNNAVIVNNYEWFSSINIIAFLKDIGKYFSINQMINKEAVKQRINRNDSGISFSEFSYNLLQAYDFAWLNKKYNVILQIGGSDQWGNIISGIHLTNRLYKNTVFGLTVPLITKSDGTKFGKTESGTIWLDPKETSPYKFYQFWINTTDNDVYRFLKLFTFLSISDIKKIEEMDKTNKVPCAQKILAEYMTKIVHGESGFLSAQRITNYIFTDELFINLIKDDFLQLVQDGMPTFTLTGKISLQEALVVTKLAISKTQAKTMIESGAITINKKKQCKYEYFFSNVDILCDHYTLLCRGKKNYCLIFWQDNTTNNI